MMRNKPRRSSEQLQAVLELRRSNAAMPHKNKNKYSRKIKHKSLTFSQ
jgi:hypothetical protein